jgi:hypothetical protein
MKARLCGVWRHRLLAFFRERRGEPFTARQVFERFDDLGKQQTYQLLGRMRQRGDLVVLRHEERREYGATVVRWYAPVLRGEA